MKEYRHGRRFKFLLDRIICMICVCTLVLGTAEITTVSASDKGEDGTSVKVGSDSIYVEADDHEGKEYIKATRSFFASSYVVTLTWNLSDQPMKKRYSKEWLTSSYSTKKSLKIDNKTTVNIYYTTEYKSEAKNKDLDKSLINIITSLKKNSFYCKFPIKNLLVSKVKKIDQSKYKEAAQDYFDHGNYSLWHDLYKELDSATKEKYRKTIMDKKLKSALDYLVEDMSDKQIKQYLERAYKDKNTSFILILVDEISDKLISEYTKKSYNDNYLACFDLLYDELSNHEIDQYIEKSYVDQKLSFYVVLADAMDDDQYDRYIERSYQDNRLSYFAVLSDDLNDDGFDEYLKKSYKDNKIQFFRLLIDDADDETIRSYYKKAVKEGKKQYIDILEKCL